MAKLHGREYIDYWRVRMAKGPDQAAFDGRAAEDQGRIIWEFIRPRIEAFAPAAVLEFGCGWGRMLRKLHDLWPSARISGVDLCPEALDYIEATWPDTEKPMLLEGDGLSHAQWDLGRSMNLVFSCLALQHVTDDLVLVDVSMALKTLLAPGGRMVLFENVSRPGSAHVRDMQPHDYMQLWPSLAWREPEFLGLNRQLHALLIGTSNP